MAPMSPAMIRVFTEQLLQDLEDPRDYRRHESSDDDLAEGNI